MRMKMISITLLLFELSVILAHTVAPKEEIVSKMVLTNDTVHAHSTETIEPNSINKDVYEVHEFGNKKSIAFVHPRPKKPTLREIIYYHVVERPYGKTIVEEPKPLEIDFDDSIRPFTNSHGYQFTEEHHADPQVDETTTAKHVETTVEPPATRTEAKDLKMQEARESLLNKLKERRHEMKNTKNDTTSAIKRPKRQVNEIPEAPRLEEMDLPQLGFMFTTVQPGIDKNEDPTAEYSYTYPTENKPDIKDKVEDIFVTLKPFDETQPNDGKGVVGYLVEKERMVPENHHVGYDKDGNKVVYVIDHGNSEDGRPDNIMTVTEKSRVTPDSMTYGMNLSLDHGYVWNKLVEPAVLYAVGNEDYDVGPTVSTLDVENNNAVVTPTEIVIDEQVHLTEPPNHEDFDIFVNIEKLPKKNSTEARNDKYRKELKDHETKEKDEGSDDENVDEELQNEKNHTKPHKNRKRPQTPKRVNDYEERPNKNKKPTKSHPDENEANEDDKKHNKPDKNRDDDDDDSDDYNDKPVTHNKNGKKQKPTHIKKPQPSKSHKKNEKPDLYQQLLESDKFWQWLAHWTSSYTQHLTKAVKDMVKEEVKRQLKNDKPNVNEPKVNKTKDEETKPQTPAKNDTNNRDDKNDKLKPLSDKSDKEVDRNDDDKKTESPKNDTKPQEPKTNNTKTEEKEKSKEKPHVPEKIVTGNEKTTNIFIFFPNESVPDIINHILGNNNDGKKNNEKPKNETTDIKPSQNDKHENVKKPDDLKNEASKVDKPNRNSENRKEENKKSESDKLDHETHKDEKPKDKITNENPTEKKPDEAKKPEEPKPNPVTTPEKKPDEGRKPEEQKPNLVTAPEKKPDEAKKPEEPKPNLVTAPEKKPDEAKKPEEPKPNPTTTPEKKPDEVKKP